MSLTPQERAARTAVQRRRLQSLAAVIQAGRAGRGLKRTYAKLCRAYKATMNSNAAAKHAWWSNVAAKAPPGSALRRKYEVRVTLHAQRQDARLQRRREIKQHKASLQRRREAKHAAKGAAAPEQ